MPRSASKYPTERELEILKILWSGDGRPLSARQVQTALGTGANKRQLAYTSVATVLNIMTRKGYLSRNRSKAKSARAKTVGVVTAEPVKGGFVYQPGISERVTTRRMLGDLIDRVFRGSVSAMMLRLIEDHPIDKNELEAMRKLVAQAKREER